MPFTPYHFGPAAVLKAALPSKFSASAFVGTQVAIDSEVLWLMLRHQYPVHRTLHGAACATCLGLGIGAAIHCIGNRLATLFHAPYGCNVRAEWNWTGVLLGGGLGGVMHSLLDALIYRDVQPFWPIISGNPLLGILGAATIQLACLLAGLVGVVWLVGRLYLAGTAG